MRQDKLRGQGNKRAYIMTALWVMCALSLAAGCTRNFYRRAADTEVSDILAEKDIYPEWKIEQFHVYPDPRARFANPGNPDRPAMPPDDEAAWKLSPHPQRPGHAGVATVESTTYLDMLRAWDAENRSARNATVEAMKKGEVQAAAQSEENRTGPIQEMIDASLATQPAFLLKLEQAVEFGLINSRDYQNFREDLYLAALPVTVERFSFAWQWLALEDAVRQWSGSKSLVGTQNNWSLGTTTSVSKLFSTGALLSMSFANSSVFNFVNAAKGFSSTSTFNLNLVQPLLQGGGRPVTLEPLTRAERNLLYSIRAYAHFRRQFYTSIAIGGAVPSNLAGAAGITFLSGGAALSPLSPLGIASTDVSGQQRGYMPALFRGIDMAVDQHFVNELERAQKLFEGFQEGGQMAPLQVDQVKSTLLQARNTLLQDAQSKANALDQLKLQLGLPTNLPLVLDDTLAKPITRVLDLYYDILVQSNKAHKIVDEQEKLAPEKLRPFLMKLFTTERVVKDTEFQKKIPQAWANWAKEGDKELKLKLDKLGVERRRLLDAKTDIEMKGKTLPAEDLRRMKETEFEADLGGLEQVLRRFEAKPWEKQAKEDLRREERNKLFRIVSYSAELVLVWARNEQFARVGQLWPTLPRVPLGDIDLLTEDSEKAQEAAVQAALRNRLDLMNARARLVDVWRQLAVTANDLLGVLNVQYHLNATTPPGGSQPLAFSTAASKQELLINAQLPLVRVVERNNYRIALVNYERARRNLMSLEDGIAAQLRFDVRQLQLFADNYKIQQKLVESLYSQVENSLEVIAAPADPTQLRGTGAAGQANAAALTNQYLGALGQLNGAQSRMYSLWLSYLATRIQLYEDLERLQLDNRGVWIDEPASPADGNPGANGRPAFQIGEFQWGGPSEHAGVYTASFPAASTQAKK